MECGKVGAKCGNTGNWVLGVMEMWRCGDVEIWMKRVDEGGWGWMGWMDGEDEGWIGLDWIVRLIRSIGSLHGSWLAMVGIGCCQVALNCF